MVMITVMFKLAVFALCVGVVIALLTLVPLFIYAIPYHLWVGFQNNKGQQLDKKKESFFRSTKNATKLYKTWFLRQEPTL